MASIEELEARITALEAEVRLARQDAAAARVLAGGADRDVEGLSATFDMLKALLGAVRETQVEHGQRISTLERRLDSPGTEMRSGFARLGAGQDAILTLLNRVVSQDKG